MYTTKTTENLPNLLDPRRMGSKKNREQELVSMANSVQIRTRGQWKLARSRMQKCPRSREQKKLI